ncbi:MAG: TFIIB-type zinc ribbon-containing protein [Oscillospiraceae bacterium]|nr:TFIIB-type zinc ribbon-containing protein [Oscillospiraceae bacterium]
MPSTTFKCPNCTAGLKFSPSDNAFECEYCGGLFNEETLKRLSEEQEKKQNAEKNDTDGAVYHCDSCGAEIVTDATTAATTCYYCHNPVVLSGRLAGGMKPDTVIPFAVDKKSATEQFMKWAKSKKFVPKSFFEQSSIEHIKGVYFPYWAVDFEMDARFSGEGTLVSRSSTATEDITVTEHYRVTRDADVRLDNIMRGALKKADRQLSDGVHPYDCSKMKDFSMGYLSGFFAEKRDIESAEISGGAEGEAKNYADRLLKQDTRYSGLSGQTTVTFNKKRYKYALLPAWILTYKGRDGEMYYYAINGQSGKSCGKLPLDKGRLMGVCAAVGAAITAILCLGGWFLW